uniref:MULE transposase domain-containing protein n=1 Tax=Lactuca sativa TaxID=4236 RepID=A0A9R1V5U2_LACSA|nr:hypothetical protein LSAT_V11C600319840 [Lactuca sativa]
MFKRENARVELDDEENTDESSDEDEIIYSIRNMKVKWNVMKLVTRERALSLIDGNLSDHYARLWDYGHELMSSNPSSTTTTFHRIYVCFKAIKDGWKIGCHRVIGLDGCFWKGQCKGELLTAIGRHANNQIYPIAWAVVEVVNKVNWTWFLELVSEDLSLDAGRGLCVISDQHKGLVEATKDIRPHVEHRQCARHIYANFRKVYSGIQFRKMFWAAAKSTTEGDFKIKMDRIKTLSEGDVCEAALLKMEEFAENIRGHNKASCKNPKVVPEPKPKKKMGRPKLDPDLTNWTRSRRGDRGRGTGSNRRGKRGGGRGSGGRGNRGRGNTKFGEGTSNLDEENVVTPTVESDNEEARDVESPEVDDEIRVDVKSDIDFIRQSNYTTQEILDCLGINEEELYEFEGLKHVPVDLNISHIWFSNKILGFEFPSQLIVETLTENEEDLEQEGMEKEGIDEEGMDEEGMEQEGMNQDGMGPEGIIEEDMGIEGVDEDGMEQEGMDQEGMNQDGMGAQGLG